MQRQSNPAPESKASTQVIEINPFITKRTFQCEGAVSVHAMLDGSVLCICEDNSLKKFDVDTGEMIAYTDSLFYAPNTCRVCLFPDGTLMVYDGKTPSSEHLCQTTLETKGLFTLAFNEIRVIDNKIIANVLKRDPLDMYEFYVINLGKSVCHKTDLFWAIQKDDLGVSRKDQTAKSTKTNDVIMLSENGTLTVCERKDTLALKMEHVAKSIVLQECLTLNIERRPLNIIGEYFANTQNSESVSLAMNYARFQYATMARLEEKEEQQASCTGKIKKFFKRG